jgi:hypothetical protein
VEQGQPFNPSADTDPQIIVAVLQDIVQAVNKVNVAIGAALANPANP